MLRSIVAVILLLSIIYCTTPYAQNAPIPFNDTVDIIPGIPVTVNILSNDIIPAGDSVWVAWYPPTFDYLEKTFNANQSVTFKISHWGYPKYMSAGYRINDYTKDTISSLALIVFRIRDRSYAYIDVNNVWARFSSSGTHFLHDSAEFEVPKGTGKCALFCNNLWIGGIGPNDILHLAAQKYSHAVGFSPSVVNNFWAGPVSVASGYNPVQDTIWNRVWKVSRLEVEYHRNHFWEQDYQIPNDILEWPANGDVSLGQAPRLAPFSDRNTDGIYDPKDGDYPEIRGDQALFFIFNDDHGFHSGSLGEIMKLEVHALAYAFDRPDDTAFKNTVFLHYKFYNRSQDRYSNTWVGVFSDIDLGYAYDDFIGCDVERGMYYGYNGKRSDGSGQSGAYGENPPVQAVVMLGGPFLDVDGYDNPAYRGSSLNGPSFKGNCNMVLQNGDTLLMKYGPGEIYEAPFIVRSGAVNGMNFGDGIIDNERFGMRKFSQISNNDPVVPNQRPFYPRYANEYYDCMRGIWNNGLKMSYGGTGQPMTGAYGPICDFAFPGMSDTCLVGTSGLMPNGPMDWTEKTAGIQPGGRRGMSSTGPFTFLSGAVHELDLAFVWARGDNPLDSTSSLSKIRLVVDTIILAFRENHIPGGGTIYGLKDPISKSDNKPKIYPNPASDRITIEWNDHQFVEATFSLKTIQGKTILKIRKPDVGQTTINLSNINQGVYFLHVEFENRSLIEKIIVQKKE